MPECDGFFDGIIPFEPGWDDEAVHFVRSSAGLTLQEKKELILCWFDVTYGSPGPGARYELRTSRQMMRDLLARTPYNTYEQMLEADYERQDRRR